MSPAISSTKNVIRLIVNFLFTKKITTGYIIVWLYTLIIFHLFFIYCNSSFNKKDPSNKEILQAFGDPTKTNFLMSTDNKIKNITIFEDGSISQKGFTDQSRSLDRKYKKAIIDKSVDGWSEARVKLCKIEKSVHLDPTDSPVNLHYSDFYNQLQSDLTMVIDRFCYSLWRINNSKSKFSDNNYRRCSVCVKRKRNTRTLIN